MATIREVAKASGVSIATVSHVINGRQSKVGPETRERVLAAVRELRYRPPALEDRQKAILTKNIGFLAGDVSLPVFGNEYRKRVFDGVVEAAALRENSVTIFIERMWDDVGKAVRRAYDGRCDGLVMLAPKADSEAMRTMWERGVPIVTIGSTAVYPGIPSVDIDNEAAGLAATRFLRERGHTQIAYLGPEPLTTSSLERSLGYQKGMEGLPSIVVFGTHTSLAENRRAIAEGHSANLEELSEGVYHTGGWVTEALDALLETLMPDTTAIVAWNDSMARDLVRELAARGKSVPGDVSIVSFDDCEDATNEDPKLTTFRQPLPLLGRTAANILLDRIGDHDLPVQSVRYMPDIVERHSVRTL